MVLYGLVFFTGDRRRPSSASTSRAAPRSPCRRRRPTTGAGQAALDQARQIIERRVNGLGVAEAEVVTQSPDIVISVPGANGDAAKRSARPPSCGYGR